MTKRVRRSAPLPRSPSVQPVCPCVLNAGVGDELDFPSMIVKFRTALARQTSVSAASALCPRILNYLLAFILRTVLI